MLTDDQVRAFFRDGYFVVRSLFSAAEVAEIAAAFDRLQELARDIDGNVDALGANFVVEQVDDGAGGRRPKIRRVSWCGGADPLLLEVGADRRLLSIASSLLGSSSMDQLINQAHFKEPGDGVLFPWHQDSQHRGYGTDAWQDLNGKGSYVQTAVAIDESTRENGPLMFVPGSCAQGHLGLPYDEDSWLTHAGIDTNAAVPILAAPGDVAVFGPYTVHGSQPNRSTTARRVFINGYAYPGANSRQYRGDGAGRRLTLASG
jgi:ectoine hydroxylase-related dioxygenase (phytanoyl-CoA dioxygenase family)